MTIITRRNLLVGASAGLLAGCDSIANNPLGRKLLLSDEKLHQPLQRLLIGRTARAPEYRRDQMSPFFRTNGTRKPDTPAYQALLDGQFADWRLRVDGLVDRPLTLTLAQLRAMPAQTQITRHDCVEGWSAVGEWHGPRLALLLDAARLRPQAKYLVFHCMDRFVDASYYESIDLVDLFHPQTILAWGMNGKALSVGHGAPVRLRVERQLGYKQAKFIERIEAVASLDGIGGGRGGYWEDVADYEWYAGI
jgi:DMSO/TMAO reductase YedYZ molybdopterin-dependent catalytic subunit